MDACDLSVVMEKKDTVPTGRRDSPPQKKGGRRKLPHEDQSGTPQVQTL